MSKGNKLSNTIALDESGLSALNGLIGRNLYSIGSIQLEILERNIRGASFCFYLREPYSFGTWDRDLSFVSFCVQDEEFFGGYVVSVLKISTGIAASEIPFDETTCTPGPCSLITGWVKDFVISQIQIVESLFMLGEEGVSSQKCCVEAGLLFKSNDNREFLILADQTGDLYFYPNPNHEEIFTKERKRNDEVVLRLVGEI